MTYTLLVFLLPLNLTFTVPGFASAESCYQWAERVQQDFQQPPVREVRYTCVEVGK